MGMDLVVEPSIVATILVSSSSARREHAGEDKFMESHNFEEEGAEVQYSLKLTRHVV
jgi:hypothetical protein